jgi:DNA-binding transcriptional LysR family regulator
VSFQDLDIDLLRCLVAVADAKGFTAAGKVLGRTQSAVTIKIQRLEQLVDRQLLKRTSRSLSLTEEGELLLGYARRILDLHDEGLRRVAAPPLDGTLHLGIAEHFVPERLPLFLSQFARTYPRVKLEVVVDTGIPLVESLDTGQLDLAIATRTEGKGRPGQLLFQEPLVWVASNDFILNVSDSVPLALKPDPCQFRDEALAALQRVGRPWTSSYTGNSVPSIQAAVLAGLGVSVLGAHSVQNGMRVAQDELPVLPSIDIMLFGEEKFGGAIAKALVNFVLRSVKEQENLMAMPLGTGLAEPRSELERSSQAREFVKTSKRR